MKKIILLGLVLFLSLPVVAEATSIGGAETQGQERLAVGMDVAFLLDKDLKFKSATGLLATQEIKNVETDKGYQVMLKTSYGLLDNLDAYIKLGLADFEAEDDNYMLGIKWADDIIDSSTDFAYGFGLKGKYELEEDWWVGCDLQYLRSKHEAKVTQDYVFGSTSTKYKSFVVQEWHIAPYIAKRINNFAPYFGVRYSDMRLKMKNPDAALWLDDYKLEADDNVGVFLGTDYEIDDNLVLNLEVRFIDEMALSFGADYKF